MFKDLADIMYIEIYERITNKDIIVCFKIKAPKKIFKVLNYTIFINIPI